MWASGDFFLTTNLSCRTHWEQRPPLGMLTTSGCPLTQFAVNSAPHQTLKQETTLSSLEEAEVRDSETQKQFFQGEGQVPNL